MTLKAAPVNCREDRGIEENDIYSHCKVNDNMTRRPSDQVIDRFSYDEHDQGGSGNAHEYTHDLERDRAVRRKLHIACFKKSSDQSAECRAGCRVSVFFHLGRVYD